MYHEIRQFAAEIAGEKSVWRDGDIWTAAVLSGVCFASFIQRPFLMDAVSRNLGHSISITGIIFGFVLTALTYYVSVTPGDGEKQRDAMDKLVLWHVWTVVVLLIFLAAQVAVWATDAWLLRDCFWLRVSAFSTLSFLGLYGFFQILNHSLNLLWFFRNRSRIESGRSNLEKSTEQRHQQRLAHEEPVNLGEDLGRAIEEVVPESEEESSS